MIDRAVFEQWLEVLTAYIGKPAPKPLVKLYAAEFAHLTTEQFEHAMRRFCAERREGLYGAWPMPAQILAATRPAPARVDGAAAYQALADAMRRRMFGSSDPPLAVQLRMCGVDTPTIDAFFALGGSDRWARLKEGSYEADTYRRELVERLQSAGDRAAVDAFVGSLGSGPPPPALPPGDAKP